MDGNHVTLKTPNEFSEVWLKDNYISLLQDALTVAAGRQLQIRFKVAAGGATIAAEVTPAPAKAKASDHAHERPVGVDISFNPKNTFDTFVVGNNNSFAHAAALAVAQAPGKSYNPLFLYGGVGTGQNASASRDRPACFHDQEGRAGGVCLV